MGAFQNSDVLSSKFHNYNKSTDTLHDWINTVRCKKIIMKRKKRNQDLRVAAILSHAIICAENDLKKKQNERVLKWAQLKMRFEEPEIKQITEEEEMEQKQQIDNLWSCELNGLNSFMNNLNQVKTAVVR